jgi:hypothetical protein
MGIRMIGSLLAFTVCITALHSDDSFDPGRFDRFGRDMAEAIVKDQQVVWAGGFGLQRGNVFRSSAG